MNEPLKQFERLAEAARSETPPQLDVVATVAELISTEKPLAADLKKTPISRPRRYRAIASVCVVVALLASGAVFWLNGNEATAEASLAKALAAAELPGDRVYHVELDRDPHWPLRQHVEATLTVRGGNQFVLDYPEFFHGRGQFGTDGHVAWHVPQYGPVIVNSDPRVLKEWLAQRDVSLPFLSLQAILQRMADRYEVTRLPSEMLDDYPGHRLLRIHCRRHIEEDIGPHEVDLWIDPDTYVARKVRLRWTDESGPRSLRLVSFRLIREETRPNDWYAHDRHHEPSRDVISLPIRLQ